MSEELIKRLREIIGRHVYSGSASRVIDDIDRLMRDLESRPAPAVQVPEWLVGALVDWVRAAPHGDNCFLHNDGGEFDRCFCGKDSLLSAVDEAPAPAATVQVPDEPTEAMLAAFCDVAITPGAWVNSTDADRKQVRDELTKCYHAMLAAAPSPATVATEAVAQEADTATLAYDAGFRRACDWARRDDLLHELESFAYKQDRAFDIERLGLADAHALLDAAVAQGGGVDVEKVMGLVEEYGDLMCSVGMNSGQPWARKHTAECRKEADTSLAQIRALLSAPPAASGWIPVGERRPGVGVVVLGFWKNSAGPHSHVTGQNYGITARNEHGLWYDASEDDNEDDEWMRPDYWQPLPPPPAIANQEAQDGR